MLDNFRIGTTNVVELIINVWNSKALMYTYIYSYFFTKAPPIIAVSPPPTVSVSVGQTFIINCTTLGVPTPEIVWRLNWGSVTEKCTMSSTPQEGNRAFGELICPNAQDTDQGAYSCESINIKGSCFAGSTGTYVLL